MVPIPDIWPEKATAATSSARPEAASARAITRCAEASMTSGSCSTHPERGRSSGTSSNASPSRAPVSSTTAALLPIVPRSHPTNTAIRSPPVPRVGHDLDAAVVGAHRQHREAALGDRGVVVPGVTDVGGEEDERLATGHHAAVRPAARDVVRDAGEHRLLAVLAALGGHQEHALTGERQVAVSYTHLTL